MVAAGDVWEGHELLREERGLVRHFLARQVGDTGALVWLHVHEGARLDACVFAEEIARLQRLADEVPEVVPVLYGGVSGSVAWAASPVLGDAIPLLDAARGDDLGPADLQVLIDVGRCLVRAHERSFIHGALCQTGSSLGTMVGTRSPTSGLPGSFSSAQRTLVKIPMGTHRPSSSRVVGWDLARTCTASARSCTSSCANEPSRRGPVLRAFPAGSLRSFG